MAKTKTTAAAASAAVTPEVQHPAAAVPATRGTGSSVAREDFGGREVRTVSTAANAVAEAARAFVQGRMIVAKQDRRDIDNVRVSLKEACARRKFADMALYSIPFGESRAIDFTVNFMDTAKQMMGNLDSGWSELHRDDTSAMLRVYCVDLETNSGGSRDVTIFNEVERKRPRPDQTIISERQTSQGGKVYIVAGTREEFSQVISSKARRVERVLIKSMIPRDILDECREVIDAAKLNAITDPAAERKKITDGFAKLHVKPSDLKEYLGHAVAQSTPAELVHLREVYEGLRSGEGASWADVLAARVAEREAAREHGVEGATDKKKEQLKGARAAKEEGADATPPPANACQGCGPDADVGEHKDDCPQRAQGSML